MTDTESETSDSKEVASYLKRNIALSNLLRDLICENCSSFYECNEL